MCKKYLIPILFLLSILTNKSYSQELSLDDDVSLSNISFYSNLKQGKIVFATTEVEAEFNSLTIQKQSSFFNSNEWFYNLYFDYMFNKSKVNIYSGLVSIGKVVKLNDRITLNPSIGYGMSLYKEQSTIQNVNSVGNNFFGQATIDYNIKDNIAVSLNLQINYQTHARSLTATNNADQYCPQKSNQ